MIDLLTSLLLQVLLLFCGLLPGLNSPPASAAPAESMERPAAAAFTVIGDTDQPELIAARTCGDADTSDQPATCTSAARMRWQVTLLHSPTRRCDCTAG